jgi:hypothetical protein
MIFLVIRLVSRWIFAQTRISEIISYSIDGWRLLIASGEEIGSRTNAPALQASGEPASWQTVGGE